MNWEHFYYESSEWSETTLKSRISSLKDIGPGHEVVDILIELPTQALKTQLLHKAIKHHVIFTHDDFVNLVDELDDESYKLLGEYAGFHADDPFIDDNNLTWEDFYSHYLDWDDETLSRRIHLIKDFTSNEELLEVISWLSDDTCKNALFEKASSLKILTISWDDLYNYYTDLTENILYHIINSLTDVGSNNEIIDVLQDLPTDDLKELLVNKAIYHKITFTYDEYMILEEELSYAYFNKISSSISHHPKYTHTITWEDFYDDYYDWDEKETLLRIKQLVNIGPSHEVYDTILGMPTTRCEDALYNKAIKLGITFTTDQLIDLGKMTIKDEYEENDSFKIGFLGMLGLLSLCDMLSPLVEAGASRSRHLLMSVSASYSRVSHGSYFFIYCCIDASLSPSCNILRLAL